MLKRTHAPAPVVEAAVLRVGDEALGVGLGREAPEEALLVGGRVGGNRRVVDCGVSERVGGWVEGKEGKRRVVECKSAFTCSCMTMSFSEGRS